MLVLLARVMSARDSNNQLLARPAWHGIEKAGDARAHLTSPLYGGQSAETISILYLI